MTPPTLEQLILFVLFLAIPMTALHLHDKYIIWKEKKHDSTNT